MRTVLVASSQIVCLTTIAYLGHSLVDLLRVQSLITDSAINWYVIYGRYLYLSFNVALILSAVVAFIVGGSRDENQIVTSKSPVGLTLFNVWMTQNVIVAVISLASFVFVYTQTPPEFRRYLLPRVMW